MVRGDIFNKTRYLSVILYYLGLKSLDTYNRDPFSGHIQVGKLITANPLIPGKSVVGDLSRSRFAKENSARHFLN